MSDTAAHRAAIAHEYGQFRAIQQIYYDGVLAYNEGHAVPASNVELHGYLDDGLVERVSDESAPPPEPPSDPTADAAAAAVDLNKAAGKRAGSEG